MPGNREEQSDAALWLEAVSGTTNSFAVLYERHRRSVYIKAWRSTHDQHDAEDIVAMVFLEAWRKRDGVRVVDGTILPWLLATTTFVTLNLARNKRRYRASLAKLPVVESSDDWADVDDEIDRQRLWKAVQLALPRLSEMDQLVVQLAIMDGLSEQAIADVLEVAPGTVKSRLARARGRLRAELSSMLEPHAESAEEQNPGIPRPPEPRVGGA